MGHSKSSVSRNEAHRDIGTRSRMQLRVSIGEFKMASRHSMSWQNVTAKILSEDLRAKKGSKRIKVSLVKIFHGVNQ